MFDWLRRIFGEGGDSRPEMLILVDADSVGKRWTANRLELLAAQAKEAGIPKTTALAYAKPSDTLPTSEAYRTITPPEIPTLKGTRPTLVVDSRSYHLSHEWMTDLLKRTAQSGRATITGPGERAVVDHLRLRPDGMALTRELAQAYLKALDSGQVTPGQPAAALNVLGTPFDEVAVTGQNAFSIYRQAAFADRPYSFIVETNSSCNYACMMCPYHGSRQKNLPAFVPLKKYEDMPYEVFERVIDEIAALKRPYEDDAPITISPYRRGEFLLYPHWKKALSHIKSKGVRAYFSSNGSLWKDEDIDFILDVGLDQMQISIEGHDVDSHRKIRLNNEFQKVAETIRKLMARKHARGLDKPFLQIAHTINQENMHLVNEYVDFWIDKVDALYLGPENFMEMENQNKQYKLEFAPVQPKPNEFRTPCGMLKDNYWVNAEGAVLLCIGSKMTEIGNVQKQTLDEILLSPIRQEVILAHAQGKYDNPTCRNCHQWFSAYMTKTEDDRFTYYMSPDTQYYYRKKPLALDW